MSYLDRVLDCLKNQTYKPDKLIVIYDGPDSNFLAVRNKVIQLDMDLERVIIPSDNTRVPQAISDRRHNIVNNHNKLREVLTECDWVWSIEDDGILPDDALEKQVALVKSVSNVGMVTGVELGRWGREYVGAWTVDNVEHPTQCMSLMSRVNEGGIEKIDGCGLYCALIRYDGYKNHNFYTDNGLGPDVNLGLYLRSQGYDNFIDWSIHVTHLTNRHNKEIEIPATSNASVVFFTLLSGSIWQHR